MWFNMRAGVSCAQQAPEFFLCVPFGAADCYSHALAVCSIAQPPDIGRAFVERAVSVSSTSFGH
jgi:hypothetical protein